MAIVIDKCEACKCQINGPQDFRDDLSRKEFHISGLCQDCQNEVFDVSEDEAVCCMACGKPFYDGGGLYCSSYCEELGNPSGEGL